jgi:aminoglycoside 6'-N-acetyltransferase
MLLHGRRIKLRQLDWTIHGESVCRWNQDPQILEYIEEDFVEPRSSTETRQLYEYLDKIGTVLIAELDSGEAIGEITLNQERVPLAESYRVNILIGEMDQWDKGLGTDMIRTVLAYCFGELAHSAVFALDVNPLNIRSLRMFTRCGFVPYEVLPCDPESESRWEYKMALRIDADRYGALRHYLDSLPY